jgi:hypothetical protein
MWLYTRDGAEHGPVSHAALCELFAGAALPLETRVWHEGLSASVPASEVEDFRFIWGKGFVKLATTPPPLPAGPGAQERHTLSHAVAAPAPTARTKRPRIVDDEDAPGSAPQVRPWVRWLARGFDNSVVGCGLLLAAGPLPVVYALLAGAALGALVFNPLQLWMFGTTIGKAILGVSVEREDGARPSIGQAFGREWLCLLKGLGLCLPVVSFITGIVGYSKLVAEGTTSWDAASGLVVRHRAVGLLRAVGYLAASCALTFATFTTAVLKTVADARSQGVMTILASLGPRPAEATPSVSIMRTDATTTAPTTRPAAVKKKGKPKLLTLPSDKGGWKPEVKSTAPTTRPVRRLDRPAPSVIFKPAPAQEPN